MHAPYLPPEPDYLPGKENPPPAGLDLQQGLKHGMTASLEKILANSDFQRKIARFIRLYSIEVSAWEESTSDERYPEYRDRLAGCIRFHTEQLIERLSEQSARLVDRISAHGVGQFVELIRRLDKRLADGLADLSRQGDDGLAGRLTVRLLEQSEALTFSSVEALLVSLPEGVSLPERTPLEGNPLRDCVLASAMLCQHDGAVEYFQQRYFGYLKGIAFQVHAHFGNDPDEWWNEFLDFLAGYTHDKGKLATYQGKCALQYWLRVVLWNFLRRRPFYGSAYEFPEEIPMAASNEEDLSLQESVALFSQLIREALEALPEKHRLVLSMIYIDRLLKKDIAAVFQVHPGQIGRWEESALQMLRKEITQRLEKLPRKDLHEEIIGGTVNNPKEFSEALTDALKKLRDGEE